MKKLVMLVLAFAGLNLFITSSYAATVRQQSSPPSADDKIQFNGTFLFPVKITIPVTDSSGNRRFRTSARRFAGTIRFINEGDDLVADQNGCFVDFSGEDGSSICIDKQALITTFNSENRTNNLLLIGTGGFSLQSGGVTKTGQIYIDTKGSIKKDSLGNIISIGLNGKVAGGSNGDLIFNGNFKSTLVPSGKVLVITTLLTGSQEVHPVTTTGSGTATFVVNLDSRGISGTVTFSGLSSNAVEAHINQAAAGTDGLAIITLEGGSGGTSGVWKVPDGTFLTQDQFNSVQADQLYVNVQSVNFPLGEIRGQLVP